ncbi:MAG: hypothetical protein R3F62_18060 [Planctomycetota bacterium]
MVQVFWRGVAIATVGCSIGLTGCSQGSGGSGGGGSATTAGAIVSGLPNPDRDPIGYSFQEIQLNQDAGGAVSALAQDPDATAIVALHTPGNTATGVQTDNTTADGDHLRPGNGQHGERV